MAPKRLKGATKALHTAEHVVGGEARHAAELLRTEPFWQAQAALIGALILYVTLPTKLILGPTWLMPALELLLVVGLWVDRPRTGRATARRDRTIVLVLLAMVAAANLASLELLVHYLLHGGKAAGRPLIIASIVIWLTNVAVFGLWFWQLDRGGPDRRSRGDDAKDADFLFVQMTEPSVAPGWLPTFVDYLYLSFTNATAFSPTDTMPLTARAKLMMMGESLISLVTVLLVAARAVSVLT
ncbi:MAG: hypothetical protein QOC78_41 [Solirubrobacteraceae bacterium]|jgi:uncharacterized membrane protein|nr:hypothetical protein [Solirubrobacteraceae bacterium]MEA2392404.1 hypothetical protein [Solirubrobacteraceae bacterium]